MYTWQCMILDYVTHSTSTYRNTVPYVLVSHINEGRFIYAGTVGNAKTLDTVSKFMN